MTGFDLYVDFKCPASRLAFEPTLALAKRTGATIAWHPFRSRQELIHEAREDETVAERHRRVRAIQRRAVHSRYAEALGVALNFRDDPGSSDAALAALLALQDDPVPFIAAAFEAYWADGADLGDPDVVAAVAEGCGTVPPDDGLARATTRIDGWQDECAARGIFFTPSYVIGDELFVGREHLPWIEELLRG